MKKYNSLIKKFNQYFIYLSISLGFLILYMIFLIISKGISEFIFKDNSIEKIILIRITMIIFTLLSFKISGIEIKNIIKNFSFKINILDLIILLIMLQLLGTIFGVIQQNIIYNFFRDFYIDYNNKLYIYIIWRNLVQKIYHIF